MKEALILVLIILVAGSIINSFRHIDVWGSTDTPGTAACEVPMVNESTFDKDVLGVDKPVLVDFYKNDSNDSRTTVPIIANVARKLKGTLKVVRLDVAENPMLARRYSVQALPDFVLFRDEQNIDHLSGAVAESKLLSFIDHALKEERGDALMNSLKDRPGALDQGASRPGDASNKRQKPPAEESGSSDNKPLQPSDGGQNRHY